MYTGKPQILLLNVIHLTTNLTLLTAHCVPILCFIPRIHYLVLRTSTLSLVEQCTQMACISYFRLLSTQAEMRLEQI